MAEGRRDIVIIDDNAPGTGPPMGLTNTLEAEAYCMGIEKIMDDFRELLNEDRKDALVTTVQALKRHMAKSWENMAGTEVDAVMRTIQEPSCVMLRQSLEEGTVTAVDPEEDVLTGRQVLSKVQPKNQYMIEHVISLFNSLSTATEHLSVAFANLSSLAKICDKETFRMILAASA